jgi:drug/metabolite transporter (DMT)-like permease
LCVYGAFYYAVLAGINLGVIATTLTCAIFFSALNFYIVYKELLSITDWLGAFLIIIGVSTIGFFKQYETNNSEVNENSAKYTWIAIFLGLSASMIIGATSVM